MKGSASISIAGHNDFLALPLAFSLFVPVLIAPGYLLGWLLDLLSFRSRRLPERLLLSLPFGIALTPVAVYLLGRFLGFPAIWVFYACCMAGLIFIRHPRGRFPRMWIPAGWMALAGLSLADLTVGRRLYPSAVAFDYLFRTPIVSALTRATALPPANPFFFPGHPVPFRYHYFWFLLASFPAHFVAPRQALIAGTVWAGLALVAITILYLRRRRAPLAILLLCVSGLDILPVGALDFSAIALHKGPFYPTVDWWNTDQVTGWMDSVLWVPHDVSALVACLTGFLLLYRPRKSWRDLLAAAFAVASAAGLSIFVTLVFAVFLALWFTIRLDKRALFACFLAAVLATPFLLELSSAGTPAAGFLRLGVRVFKPVRILHLPFEPVFNLLALPLNYFLEFGFFAVVAVWKWRQPRAAEDGPAATLLAVSLLIATFVRSTSIEFNDLGARGMLPAQFVLLLWSVQAFDSIRRHRLFAATFALGLATTGYELLRLRTALILNDLSPVFAQSWISPDNRFGERNFAMREAYEWLDAHTPPSAIIQPNPEAFQEIFGGLYSNRQYALASIFFSDFGGSEAVFRDYAARLPIVFHPNSDPVPLCKEMHIGVLVFKDIDPIWHDPSSWIWHRTPLFANDRSRSFSCAKIGTP